MNDVDAHLSKLVKQLTIDKPRREAINNSFLVLKEKIWGEYQDRLKAVEMFGSYDRGTELPQSIDEKSDVDVLVIFKTNDFNPTTLLKQLLKFADTNYSRSDVTTDHPTVVIEMIKVRFEIVPAYWESVFLSSDELKIPAPKNKELKWITTNPQELKSDLDKKNKEEKQMLIPLIKLIKYLNVKHDRPFDSFELEKFATSRSYPCKNLRDYFFELIADLNPNGKTESQKAFITEMKTRKENLIALEKRNLTNYIQLELQEFVPLI